MDVKQRFLISAAMIVALAACSSGGDSEGGQFGAQASLPEYNFTAADAIMEDFVAQNASFDGVSYTIVDQVQGTVHEAAIGDHDADLVVMLASTSKVPAVLLLMALHEDPNVDFDIEAPISNYLPWVGVYGDSSAAQLVSNTSGIVGLSGLGDYGTHACQFVPVGTLTSCGEVIYTTEIPNSVDPGTRFSYGGSQWQLAGAVAEAVGGASWGQLFDQYIAGPCDLDVFRFGNQWSDLTSWTGSPDSQIGLSNPNIEGGAISNMQDYAKLLQMMLDGGSCGDTQVLSADALALMRMDRGGALGTPYGMGWWIRNNADGSSPTLFYDPGLFGAMSWIDTSRGYAGYMQVDEYGAGGSSDPYSYVLANLLPHLEEMIDTARAVTP